ncbi:DUF4350 domain-containing protein [Nocardioides sp. KIGAM211]|uniref:DUF4350 domain-containing protein n=1 Tax=Nocardioides luti TaxID=2761101 RepID=A0A7X0RI43_9ACTN|nr:DUF4350 domain-containing protein [Nocardioides luti]MBB6628716.1 DUF4350 domain-containing protein [Nocardioides luti]
MTTTSTSPTAAETGPGGWLRRQRTTLLLVAGVVAALLVVVFVGAGGARTSTPLDPDNPDPDGARALARVLEDQGVDVTVVRSAGALEDADTGAGTTVLVTSTEQLGQSTTDRLLASTRQARLVLADPGPGTTEALGVSDLPYQVQVPSPRASACDDPTYAGLEIEVDDALEYPVPGGCFRGEHGAVVAEPRDGVVLFGAGDALTNGQVLRAGNAATVLRLLGSGDRLVWYVPTVDDLVGDDGVSLQTLLPRWIRPALWLGGTAVLALVLWRARRFGALSSEPLPVVVKAIETTRSRGRLYRKAGDRGHAAAALRRAARTRMAERLRLGSASADTVVRDVARHVGRPVAEVEALLGPDAPAPTTDHALITLAERLAELDREVRTT